MPTDLRVSPATKPLEGSVPVPSDKSIGHRALLFGALAHGTSRVTEFSGGEDNVSTANALRAMGVTIDDVGKGEIRVRGVGLFGLRAPSAPLDCGNSGTTMRLLSGLLVAQPFETTLVGDESLSRRPMLRIAEPLRLRGGRVDGAPHPKKPGDITAPLRVGPLPEGQHLGPLEYASKVASAQVKSAVLLSGLYAHGTTTFREPEVSRDHTERILRALGAPINAIGPIVELDTAGWNGMLPAFEVEVPGDLSAAAFLMVAGCIVPGSRVTVRNVGNNPTRTGILEIAKSMGASLTIEALGERNGEPLCNLHVSAGPLTGALVGGERTTRAIDEIPIACALAARATGTTNIRDATELRVKESDRIATMATALRAFGVACEELPDGLSIEGKQDLLEPAEIECHGDHRIAMTGAVLALLGRGPSVIRDCECIGTSFPKFVGTLRALGAEIEVVTR